ncbi:MAG TPA: ankyrin repeat domain-containing protein [Treponemataceae bacterium]|nr:ankyrin repeat domain-containing protein [Treponemataceae bacterium]
MHKTNWAIILVSISFFLIACNSTPKEIEKERSLQELIQDGNTTEIEALFQSKIDIDEIDSTGNTALHMAAEASNSELASFLLYKGADVSIKNNLGETALHAAIHKDSIDVVSLLAPISNALFAKDGKGDTSLKLALEKGMAFYPAIINTQTGSKTDASGQSLLHFLVKTENIEAVSFAIKQSIPLSIKDNHGLTPLHLAYKNASSLSSIKIAASLILADANPIRGTFSYFEDAIKTRSPSLRLDEGQTPLHIATITGSSGIVTYLLERKAATNAKDISGSTPLHEAVRYGQVHILKLLLDAGSDVDSRDSMNKTALLILSPEEQRNEIYDILISYGADVNAKDLYGDTPLHIATMTSASVDTLSKLVKAGADCNERNKNGVTPLALAVEQKKPEQIAFYSSLGADIHAEDMQGNTPLSRALESNEEVTKQLLDGNSLHSRDSYGNTPLHIAILHNAPKAQINYLIKAGSEINARNRNGDSPLYLAIQQNSRFVGELLLIRQADVFATNTENYSPLRLALTSGGEVQDWLLTSEIIKASDGVGNTPLHYACEWKLNDSVAVLLEKGAKPNVKNTNGESPLFFAIKGNNPSTIELLLKNNADINSRDYLGNTALHACISHNADDAILTLIRNGAAINVQNISGKTPLHEAASTGQVALVNILLTNNADINTADATGRTPLIDAIQANQIELVKILLKRGASPMIQEMYGRNAYHAAATTENIALITLIRQAGGNPLSRDSYGETPFVLVLNSNQDVINAVLGDNINLSDSDGNTPIHIAVANNASISTLQILLNKKYPVNRRNSIGLTPLALATKANKNEAAHILLKNGADPYISDNSGECAVSYAIKHNADILNSIVQTSAHLTDMTGEGILHYAARDADVETVKQLLSMGIDRTQVNISGETPYDIAVRWQRAEIAVLLK